MLYDSKVNRNKVCLIIELLFATIRTGFGYFSLANFDCRFRVDHVPGSINLPSTEAFSPDGSLANKALAQELLEGTHKGKIIIIVGNTSDSGAISDSVAIVSGCG